MLSDPAGRIVTYSYDGDGRLITVSYPDGSTVEYTYDASARLSCVKQQDGTKTVYTYTSGDRVARTEKYPAGTNPETDTPEEYMDIDYRSSRSTAVSDRSGIRKVYVFDDTGRAELEYEDVPTEIDGETVAGRFQVTGTTLYQYAEKKRTFGTSVRTTDESNNMIVNGSFEGIGESPWQFVGKRTSSCESSLYDGVISTDSADKTRAYRISGVAYIDKYLKQTIPASRIKLVCGDTLIFSAWAKATSATTSENGSTRFEIRAEVRYSDGSVETQRGRYDSSYTEWQYAAVPLRISRTKTLTSVTVYLDYSRNQRICLFDNVRLVNAPSQSVTYEENLSGSASIFGTAQTIKERVTVHDGLYTTVEEKNSAYDVVRRTVTDLDGNSFVSVFAYDSAHRMVRSQNERKMMTEYTYNGKGMQTSAKSYYWDTFNPNVQREELIANEYFKNETSYDSTGEFATGVSDARSEDIKTSNSYNTVKGLLVNTTTPNGQTTSYTYDASTDLVTGVRAVVGDATYSVVYGYQERKLSSITHGGFAYGFTYDGMGRAKKVTIAGTDYTENEYALGETTTVTTSYAGGEKMRVETDRHEQPVKRTYTDKNGVETVIAEGEYDSLGKPVKVLDKITQKEYTYTYDGYENVTAEKVNGLAYKEYEYDGQNRLKKTTFHMGDETQTYRPIYDTRASDGAVYADNAVVGVTLDGVFTSKAEQDDWGRVTKKNLTTTGSTTPLLSEEYSYLDVAVGFETRLTTMVQLLTRKVKGVTKDTLRYTYDNNGNITAIRNGPGTEYYAKYTYDGLNQLTREDNAVLGKSWVFAYDTAGNILSKKEYAYTTGTLGAVLDTKTYTYAATGWKDRLTRASMGRASPMMRWATRPRTAVMR